MHISIAGNLGSGKSTICKILKEQYGFEIYSTGAIQRKIADQMGISTLELNQKMAENSQIDSLIDETTAKISAEQEIPPIVFDSRMAWKFAKETFKVFTIVDPAIAAMRVIHTRLDKVESYSTEDEAREKLLLRSKLENERFKQIYGVDNFDYRNYHLIVDTSFSTPERVCEIIIAEYNRFCNGVSEAKTSIFISPKSLYPTQSIRCINYKFVKEKTDDFSCQKNPIVIMPIDGYHYIIDGHHRALAAIGKTDYVKAFLCDNDNYPLMCDKENLLSEIQSVCLSSLYDYEDVGGFTFASYPKLYSRL